MKDSELARLLVLIGAIDRRIPTEQEIRDELPAWRAMAQEGEWPSFEAAQRAIVVYRSEHPDFPIRPGHITQTLRRVRQQARESYVPPTDQDMPREVLSDPTAYQQYMREAAQRHQDAVMAAFADGQRILAIEAGT